MADALEPCTFRDGEDVVVQGESGEDFYIIVDVRNGKNGCGHCSLCMVCIRAKQLCCRRSLRMENILWWGS